MGSSILDAADIFMEILCYVTARDWVNITLLSRDFNSVSRRSPTYSLRRWRANSAFTIPDIPHELVIDRKWVQLFVLLSVNTNPFLEKLDSCHRTLLDLSVDLKMYRLAEFLLSKGFISNIDAETMFHCIRNHDIRGATILLNCGIPVDRFRSRDDGLNVLTCSVM